MHLSYLVFCVLLSSVRSALKLGTGKSIHTVSLSKQYVPVMRGDRILLYKTAYYGTIFVGLPNPQNFTVLFDTGSGHFLLPSSACSNSACSRHQRYNRLLSMSALDIDYDGHIIDQGHADRDRVDIVYGTGEVSGEFVQEVVCLTYMADVTEATGRDDCTRLRVVMASEMTSEPFEHFEFDGVAGLGLDALALGHEFSFFGQMSRLGLMPQPCFGVFLAKNEFAASEISFGGHNEDRVASAFQWGRVVSPELGYWQVAIQNVHVGNETLDICSNGDCKAILDTGTSMLGVPKSGLSQLHWLLARPLDTDSGDVDCRTLPGPSLSFDLGDFNIHLDAEDYSRPAPMRVTSRKSSETRMFCRSSLMPVDMGDQLGDKVFIFGEPMLRKYYTKYDWREQRVGFAIAQQPLGSLPDVAPHA